jgi:hypothetical protein
MKKWVNIFIVVLFGASLVFAFGVVNTMVSLKYEINSPDECISSVTGTNLCESIKFNKIAALSSFLLAIAVLNYRVFFMNKKKEPVD